MDKGKLIRGMAGLGLAAGLLLGCDDFLGRDGAKEEAQDPTAAILGLAIKDSGACHELRFRCLRAHGLGKDSGLLDTVLVRHCVLDTAHGFWILGPGRGHKYGWGHGRHGRERDSIIAKADSAAAAALCDSLTALLARMDSTDLAYPGIKRLAAHACHEAKCLISRERDGDEDGDEDGDHEGR